MEQCSNTLLLQTLKTIWSNYLNASREFNTELKLHWVELFLFNSQFINDELLRDAEFKRFFNPVAEEICSMFLEQTFAIISKSELYSSTHINGTNFDTENIFDKNFAQLVLNAPTDCYKIVALRTFLTEQLGQHILQFLLDVDIKLIASQQSLCNLFINLFPNCPWNQNDVVVEESIPVTKLIGNLNMLHKNYKTNTQERKKVLLKNSTNINQSNLELKQKRIIKNFEKFKKVTKTSDEIAFVLLKLLNKCVAADHNYDCTLSVQSMSAVTLSFALETLICANEIFSENNTFNIIYCLLHLIENCLNNLFSYDDDIHNICYETVTSKLIIAMNNYQQDFYKLDVEKGTTHIITLLDINMIIFGIVHNSITYLSKTVNDESGNSNKSINKKLINKNHIDICVKSCKEIVQLLGTRAFSADIQLFVTKIFKIIIKIIDRVTKSEHFSLNGSIIYDGTTQKPRRRKINSNQLHCQQRSNDQGMSCYFQGILLDLLPHLSINLQEHAFRYLLLGTCCCHYSLSTFEICLNSIRRVGDVYQKYAYNFLHRKLLHTIFARTLPIADHNKRNQSICQKCDLKLRSKEFHVGLLQLYKQLYNQLINDSNNKTLRVFLKHLKHISQMLSNDIASGILAEIVLPIFREFKVKYTKINSATNTDKKFAKESKQYLKLPVSPCKEKEQIAKGANRDDLYLHAETIPTTENNCDKADLLKIILECLNIFIIYMSDIRLIKAFYNGENIQHLEDLQTEPTLIRSICDLIKIGIDNITFLGDNNQEQTALSCRLITLQLHSSDNAVQLFYKFLCSISYKYAIKPNFWLTKEQKVFNDISFELQDYNPVDILQNVMLHWSLNNELLKTSQIFYKEFAKIYSIVVDNIEDNNIEDNLSETTKSGNENVNAKSFDKTALKLNIKKSDKTIIDILKLNYNALSSFLFISCTALKRNEYQNTSSMQNEKEEEQHLYTFTPSTSTTTSLTHNNDNKAIICFSGSLESLISSIDSNKTDTLSSINSYTTAKTLASDTLDLDLFHTDQFDSVVDSLYTQNSSKTKFFFDRSSEISRELLLTESIVLFDIRNHFYPRSAERNESNLWSLLTNRENNFDLPTTTFALSEPKLSHETTAAVAAVQGGQEGILKKFFGLFGAFFSSENNCEDSASNSNKAQSQADAELTLLASNYESCRKPLLKLFEVTMAICIKGYKNEDGEKMQKHLCKLKSVILSNAAGKWQNNSEDARENPIVQVLQALLRIAEMSSTVKDQSPGVSLSNSNLTSTTTTTTADEAMLPNRTPLTPLTPLEGQMLFSKNFNRNVTTRSNNISRPFSFPSADADYLSTIASNICVDSEMELSENDEDILLLADEGYEADGEIPEVSDTEAEELSADLWHSLQPNSRYRTHILHNGLSRLVVEILMELSHICVDNPLGWCDSLLQLANRLFVMREYLGGPLFLLRGFRPVLSVNDPRLKELQQSILSLITDLNTPDALSEFFNILACRQPPVEVLLKGINYICTNSVKKVQPKVELEFPILIDGKCISTSDITITECIDRIRNYHLHNRISTPFTKAPCFLPITHTKLWNNDGITLSIWVQVKHSIAQKMSSQRIDNDVNEECLSHIVSVGTEQAMLSIYINDNMNLVFETSRPNGEIQIHPQMECEESFIKSTTDTKLKSMPEKLHHNKNPIKQTNQNSSTNADVSQHGISPIRNALKHTKIALLNSFNNMHIFNDNAENPSSYECSLIDLRNFRFTKNKWTHLVVAVDFQADSINLTVFVDSLEQYNIILGLRNFRQTTRTHDFQVIALGDGSFPKAVNNTKYYTDSNSTLDSYFLRTSVSNFMLFNCHIDKKDFILNLTSMGPDFTELTQCQVGNWKPNYGYLNLSRMNLPCFGHFREAMKFFKENRILTYSAQQPDLVMGYEPSLELDNAYFGRPYGIILYGELLQNQLQSLQAATILSGGLSTLLYLFARVVEISNSSYAQAVALDLLLNVVISENQIYAEFLQNDYLSLIGYVIKTERCTKDVYLLASIINNSCSQLLLTKKCDIMYVHENTVASLIYPQFIVSILHRYSDWYRSGAENSDVLDLVFESILALTREKHPHRDFNIEQLSKAGLVKELLNLCKMYVIESPNPMFISANAAKSFVNILSVFAGSPPSSSLMDEIMKLLLLLHKPSECYITHDRNKFYFLLTSQLPPKEKLLTTNFMRGSTHLRKSAEPPIPGIARSMSIKSDSIISKLTETDSNRAGRINRIRKLHIKKSTYKTVLNDFEENLENVADCTKLNKSALHTLSPAEVRRWRLKYKRQTTYNSSTNTCSSNKINSHHKFSKLQSSSSNSVHRLNEQKISHKRHRLHSTGSICSEDEKCSRHSKTTVIVSSSLQSLAASLCTFDSNSTKNSIYVSPIHRRSKALNKIDFYSSLGIITLQEGLITLLKNFLCLLPDTAVEDVLKHYVKVEFLLVLSNHNSCGVRIAIIKLLAALIQRLPQHELQFYNRNCYPYHLANQLSIYPTDTYMFSACVEWVSGIYGDLEAISTSKELNIQQQFGLNALLAIITNFVATQPEVMEKAFKVLGIIYMTNTEEHGLLIELGLLQSCMKALQNLYTKQNNTNSKVEDSILELLTVIGVNSLKSVGHINIIWDLLNLLSFYQTKQPAVIVRRFRSAQAKLQLNWLRIFFNKSNNTWSFIVTKLTESTLTLAESKIRLDLLIDRCSQFFTVFDDCNTPTDNEIKLFEFLVSYGISTNQRCNNFIAWGLQPSRPRDLRNYIVNALWISCRDDFLPSIICDGKMVKSLLWLSLLEDLEPPIENLSVLCKRLGINENDSTWNLENELNRIELNRCTITAKQKTLLERTIFKFESIAINCIESSMIATRRVAELQNAERKLLMNHMKDYDDTFTYTKWLEIIRRMTHEGAPWYSKERSENSWELDSTEGPSRVHNRLKPCHLDIDKRFIMEDYHSDTPDGNTAFSNSYKFRRPLDYLIASYDQQLNISFNSQILYNFPAKYLPVDGEIDGEIIVTDHKLYFQATYHCKYFYVACDILNITEIWLKRYQHQEKAFEIFLDTNQSLFFSLQNKEDWKIMRDVFRDKIVTAPDQNKLHLITQQWREGLLTNWEYLMTLNQVAGRTYNDLMQYPVFPWVLSNYTAELLDLTNLNNFRKLEKPIAVQNEENEQHYISNYNYLNNSMTNMGSMILKPYHYSSHYSNSGTVLHFLVRVPPFTSYFLRYQDNNFDLPDRTFHSLSTTWCLASRDSPTDVKELIPEFFCLPEMFENFERFNFGCRQSGERVEDVLLPPWCLKNPRLFTLIHRQALESELVRNNLHNWIDLIFGYKQTGESAVESINVFHPATYSIFLEAETSDHIERKAVETMVKTYGQMPRQLFKSPHSISKTLNYSLGEKQLLPSVRGLRWGVYLGSPQLPKPTLGNIHKLSGAEYLVPFNNTNVVYGFPTKSCVMQGAELDTFNVISWGCEDRIVRIQPLNKMQAKPKNLLYNNAFDNITACGTDPNSNQLWFGHKSGRISVYKCSNIEQQSRSGKSRQSYVQGLRLSYNSAFRKITTKSNITVKADDDLENGNSMFTNAAGTNTSESLHRDGADLSWCGPTVLVRHTDEVFCIQLSVDYKIAVTAGRDGIAVIWDLNDFSYIRTIERPAEIHHSPITLVTISPTLGDIVTVHTIPWQNNLQEHRHANNEIELNNSMDTIADECFEVTEENLDDFVNVSINPNGKSIVRLHTINARYVQHMVHEDRVLAICYSYIKEGVGINVIATAVEGGIIRLWSSWDLSFISEIVTGLSNIKSITYSTHQHLVVLTKESHIQVWECEGLYGGAPKFPQIAYK
ncbi:lysosomal-trafficking regulator isoform X2 [Teleopsis dalmanni]|uniref:lysosomal-trafficking regulator isoform X2 n=1 Tax=Teleopsis dalmanni TaxID=139649 RepID=UPI0018CF39FC|nr:lysosomal-trafficking regulator isoform X2 [Teleopsis dalmanni]